MNPLLHRAQLEGLFACWFQLVSNVKMLKKKFENFDKFPILSNIFKNG